ncbi:hypothetical protein PCCS19_43650 [Paenibacillus sp. CCS19]|uniref:hypothetical protein n=1 Tax=Paenibacillus sp. CCS19 TaxID=3158387 RepID=UPI0025696AC2|nr:hypothetical protein [Paenibacillus cellulosilyticus]GMK41309.1 hypothetical protein PCCS19_43650 [Paenibacillus cellulosilyticus]
MPFFERTNRMYKVFFTLSCLFLLITIIAYSLIRPDILNHLIRAIWTGIFFTMTIFFLVLGIVLKKIAEDAEDDLTSLTRQVSELREEIEKGKLVQRNKQYSDAQ